MTTSDFSPTQLHFLSLLEVFAEPMPVDVIAQLTGISAVELHTLTRRLTRAGWLIESGDNLLGLSADLPKAIRVRLNAHHSPASLAELLSRVKVGGLTERISPAAFHRLLSRCNQVTEAAELSYQSALDEMSEARFEAAARHLDNCLTGLEGHLDNPENARLYILATIRVLGLVKPRHQALELMDQRIIKACTAADQMGNRRNQAFLSLYQGFLTQNRYNAPESLDYLESGLEIVRSLGDDEITLRAAEFYGYFYYCRGMMGEASSWFETARTNETTLELKQYRDYLDFPIYFAHSAAFNGQFYRAVGILHALLHSAESNQNFAQARLCKANLGCILLMMGNKAEAYQHLESSLEDAFLEEDLTTIVCALSGRAWYFFQEGDIRQSYADLRDSMASAEEIGSPLAYQGFPWNLELLYEFNRLKEVSPDPQLFERELQLAEAGVNVMLRGIARRLRGKLLEANQEDLEAVRRLFESSLEDLLLANNPIELARTRAEIARFFLNGGDLARARDEAMKASLAFSYEGFSGELKHLIRGIDQLPTMGEYRKDWLTRYIELMSNLLPQANEAAMLSTLVTSTCRFFESERGGAFGVEHDSGMPYLETGSNLTEKDVRSERFAPQLKLIKKALADNRPIIDTVLMEENNGENRECHVLCLPFQTHRLTSGILFYDNTWSEGIYKTLDPAVLTKMSSQLSAYLDSIDSFSSQMKEISRQAIVQTVKTETDRHELIARHPAMTEVLDRARQVAPSEAPVLIQGETGVGKELLARFLHNHSARQTMPFIAVNLASIPENLLESELFGHEKGAFTGAVSRKPGLIELADKGTLFIDEVGDIPKSIQVKLLRALQEEMFMRVGGVREYHSDFRIITATNRTMPHEVTVGNFREDLYYRIAIVTLDLPPLRERRDDIIQLAEHFVRHYARQYNREAPALTSEGRRRLHAYHWPGNVRELRNVIERSVLLSRDRFLDVTLPSAGEAVAAVPAAEKGLPDDLTLEALEWRYIRHILRKTGGKMSGPGSASEILGLNRSTLYSRMRKMGMLNEIQTSRAD